MSSFTLTTLTTNGINALAQLVAGSTMEFTNIKVGDGSLGSKNPTTLTALIHAVDTLAINDVRITAAGVATVQATFTNSGKTTGFFYRELGLFCKDPKTKKEILFAYGNAGEDAEWIPPAGTATVVEKIVNLETVIGNATKVSATLQSGIYATTDQLTATLQNYATKTDLSNGLAPKANDSAVVHISGTETVTGAKTFSAKITAPGGVQGNVTGNLTGTASKATADASGNTITTTYATKTENAAKATDSAVVHLAGDETITGKKYFSNLNLNLKGSDDYAQDGADPNTNYYHVMYFVDKNNAVKGRLRHSHFTSGGSDISLRCSAKGDTSETSIGCGYKKASDGTYTPYTYAATPADTSNTTEIATTAWARKNCVDLTSAQSITGIKTYKSDGLYFTGDTVYLNGPTFKHTKFNKNDTITTQIYDVIRFGGADYANTYATTISEIRQTRYTDSDENYSGHNSLDFRVSSKTNASANSMKALQLYSTGSMQWCGKEVLTTANGMDLFSMQTIPGAKTFTGGLLKKLDGVDVTTAPATNQYSFFDFNDKNNKLLARYQYCARAAGGHDLSIGVIQDATGSGKFLVLSDNGDFRWCGHDILTTLEGVTLRSEQTIIGQKTFTNGIVVAGSAVYGDSAVNDQLGLNGDKDGKGAYVSLCNKKHALNPGGFALTAYNGTDKHGLWGYTSGALTWDDKNLVRSVNGIYANTSGNVEINTVTRSWHSGSSWYRVWSDGFVEQGGRAVCSGDTTTVSFYIVFKDTEYTPILTEEKPTNTWNNGVTEKQKSTMTLKTKDVPSVYWYACGYTTA